MNAHHSPAPHPGAPSETPGGAPSLADAPRFDPEAADAVSVVIPTFNRARSLPAAMRSVLAQTHANLELIIADDASTDGTEALVREWAARDGRVVYLRQERNAGASAARNLGLGAVRGRFVAFQDSDDEWLLDKVEFQLAALSEAGGDWGATFGMKLIHGHDDDMRYGPGRVGAAPDRRRPVTSGDITRQLLEGNLISPQTLLMRREVADAVGGFDPLLPCNNDWEYMIRMSQLTRVLYTPRPVVVAHISADSIHRRLRSKALSFLVILRKHRALFETHPEAYADRLFSAGRYLTKLGHRRAAAVCMRRAARLAPLKARPWAGLAAARVGGIRR